MFLKKLKETILNLKPSILFFNIIALIFCISSGRIFYAGGIAGENDDLAYVSPIFNELITDSFKYYYNDFGILSVPLVGSPWFIISHYLFKEPFHYPWWLPASLNLFYLIASPVNLLYSLRVIALNKNQFYSIFLFVLLFWILNPLTYKITLDGRATNLGGYWAPVYLFSVSLLTFSLLRRKSGISKWLLLVLAYIPLALHSSLFIASVPLIVLVYTAIYLFQRNKNFILYATILLSIHAIGTTITLTAPGFSKYKSSVGFATPEFAKLLDIVLLAYKRTTNTIYSYIFGTPIEYYYLVHTIILLIIGIGAVQYIRLFFTKKNLSFKDKSFFLYLFSFGFIITFHASTISTLFVDTYPLYHQFYPSLLLSIGLGALILWLVRLIKYYLLDRKEADLKNILTFLQFSKLRKFYIAGASILLLFVGWNFIMVRIEKIVNLYQTEIWIGNSLWTLRRDILNSYQTKKQKLFYLRECPARFTYWAEGERHFYKWLGYSDIIVTRYNGIKYDPDPEYEQIRCKTPMLYLWKPTLNQNEVYKVRILTDRAPYSFYIDFAIPKGAKSCYLNGQYNHVSAYSTIDRIVDYEYKVLFDEKNQSEFKVEPTGTGWLSDTQFSIEFSKVEPEFQNPKNKNYKFIRTKVHTLYPTDWWNPYPEVKVKCEK